MIFINGNVEVMARFDVSQVQNIQAVWTLNLLSQSITKKGSRAPYIIIPNLSIKEYVVEQAPWEAAVDCVQDALNLELGRIFELRGMRRTQRNTEEEFSKKHSKDYSRGTIQEENSRKAQEEHSGKSQERGKCTLKPWLPDPHSLQHQYANVLFFIKSKQVVGKTFFLNRRYMI